MSDLNFLPLCVCMCVCVWGNAIPNHSLLREAFIPYVLTLHCLLFVTHTVTSAARLFCRSVSVSVESLSRLRLFATPWTAARQASLSTTNSWSSPKLMSIESAMPSSHLILCCPLFLPSSIFPSIRVFSNESALCLHQVAKVLEFQLQDQSLQWIFRTDFL